MWQLVVVVVVGWLATVTQSFAPIRWLKFPQREFVLMPREPYARFRGVAPPQELIIRSPRDKKYPSRAPHFTVNPSSTITWDEKGWCVEAEGDKSGDVVRVNLCTGGPAQRWNLIPDDHGRSMIQLKDTNMCLDAVEKNGLEQATIQLQRCGHEISQSWALDEPLPVTTSAASRVLRQTTISLFLLVGAAVLSLSTWLRWWQIKAGVVTMCQMGPPSNPDQDGGTSLGERPAGHESSTRASQWQENLCKDELFVVNFAQDPSLRSCTSSAHTARGVAVMSLGEAGTSRILKTMGRHLRHAPVTASAINEDAGVILLSAGVGKRMGRKGPKQYVKLLGKEIALRSLDVFLGCGVKEIVIVCAEEDRDFFKEYLDSRTDIKPQIKFVGGGAERQDSVKNGLAELSAEFAVVHDIARPLVTRSEVDKVIADARQYGAALLAVPCKATVKQAIPDNSDCLVDATPDRSLLWEAHTPQVIRSSLLRLGFQNAEVNGLDVTDDVSLVELLGETVKLTRGEYTNIKLTTPEDIIVAESILASRGEAP